MKNSAPFLSKDHKQNKYLQSYLSPIGWLIIEASNFGLTRITLTETNNVKQRPCIFTSDAQVQLQEYFNMERTSFDIPFDLKGYSEFALKVWAELIKIPFGKTMSYKELSISLGDVKAIRAVGTTNGKNPIPIIIPCHRVIGSDGSLTGYALGLDIKKQLLILENPRKFGQIQTKLAF